MLSYFISSAVRATSNATCAVCAGGSYGIAQSETSCTPCPNATDDVQLGDNSGPALSKKLPDLVIQICAEELGYSAAPRRLDRAVSAWSVALVTAATVGATSAAFARSGIV